MFTYYFIRKLGHVTVYFILTILIIRALRMRKQSKSSVKTIIIAFTIAIFYAMTDEYHQSLTGFRDGRFIDVGIDSIGVILAILSYSLFLPKSIVKKNNQNT